MIRPTRTASWALPWPVSWSFDGGGRQLRGVSRVWWTNSAFTCAAYREEETYGPDLSMMRENCLVQTTEWSACSKSCGLGISTRVTNDNRECRLEKQTRLCMVRPCESQLEQSIRVSPPPHHHPPPPPGNDLNRWCSRPSLHPSAER